MSKTYVVAAQPASDKQTIDLLFNNIDKIIQNEKIINKNPDFYNITIPGVCVSGLYVGRQMICLGDLLRLWRDSVWGADGRYYYNVGGTPLSGAAIKSYWDINKKCRVTTEIESGFTAFWRAAVCAIKTPRGMYDKNINPETDAAVFLPYVPVEYPKTNKTIADLLSVIDGKNQ